MSSDFRWSAGAAYQDYVGRWSRALAAEFVSWLDVPAGAAWIDVGCGTGELTRSILSLATPGTVLAVDPSPGYLDYARDSTTDRRARFVLGTAQDVASLGATADVVVSGLVLNFVPNIEMALRAAVNVTVRGGVIAAYVWDYADGMSMIRHFWDAAIDENMSARDKDEGARFPICSPLALQAAFATAGLVDIATRPIDVTGRYADFDEYWSPFLSGEGPAPGYLVSLPAQRQVELREMVRARLPVAPDGSITLTCRAWAVRGRRV